MMKFFLDKNVDGTTNKPYLQLWDSDEQITTIINYKIQPP